MKPRIAKKILECKSSLCLSDLKVSQAKASLVQSGYCTYIDEYWVICSKKRKGLEK